MEKSNVVSLNGSRAAAAARVGKLEAVVREALEACSGFCLDNETELNATVLAVVAHLVAAEGKERTGLFDLRTKVEKLARSADLCVESLAKQAASKGRDESIERWKGEASAYDKVLRLIGDAS